MEMIAAANLELLQSLASTPDNVSKLIEGVPNELLKERDSTQEFSILENVCHLRDIELEGYTPRIKRILAEQLPLLPDVDGGQLAVERNYNSQNIGAALQSFIFAREQNVALLRTLTADQFGREGNLQGVGNVTLAKLLLMMQEHDKIHIAEVKRLSAASRK
jgi:hypothetical protein